MRDLELQTLMLHPTGQEKLLLNLNPAPFIGPLGWRLQTVDFTNSSPIDFRRDNLSGLALLEFLIKVHINLMIRYFKLDNEILYSEKV